MKTSPHLWLSLTPHGFGHAAMSSPVIDALKKTVPALRLSIQCGPLPQEFLVRRFGNSFDRVGETPDFGLAMQSATGVKVEESARRYNDLHRDLPRLIEHEAERMQALRPDLVISNISYITIAASRLAGIPVVALCCLNWADLYWHFCHRYPEARRIHQEMLECYRQADVFIRPVPAMPMPDLSTCPVGPIALVGRNRRREIYQRLRLEKGTKLGLLAFGGLAMDFSLEELPGRSGWTWLCDEERTASQRSDIHFWKDLDMPLVDIMRSADLLVSKPGYNTFAEAGVNGVPLLWVERPDWPENSYLDTWLKSNGRCETITKQALFDRNVLMETMDRLLSQPARPSPRATGAEEAASIIQDMLG